MMVQKSRIFKSIILPFNGVRNDILIIYLVWYGFPICYDMVIIFIR
jgi:hypothetical protein